MTHNDNVMVFITLQNLVAIALVVLKIQKLNILHVWPENAYIRLFWGKNRGKWAVSEFLSL